MKHGGGIKGLDDKSSGMEIHMAKNFAKIKPTDPLILARHAARRKLYEALSYYPCSQHLYIGSVLHVSINIAIILRARERAHTHAHTRKRTHTHKARARHEDRKEIRCR
jgi:hypothetical protein